MKATTFQLVHHWVLAITATCYVIASINLTAITKVNFSFAWLIGAGTFFVYRLSVWQPVYNVEQRKLFLQKNPSLFEIGILSLSILIPSYFIDVRTLILIFLTGLLSTLYFFRLNLKNKEIGGLRIIPAFKNIFLAASWSFATIYLPYIFCHSSTPILFLLFSRFVFILAICFGVDMRDVQRDIKTGTKTIAILIGFKKTKIIAIILSVVFIALTIITKHVQQLPCKSNFEHNTLLITGIILIGFLLYLSPKHKTSTYTLLLDGCMFIQAVLLVAG